MTGGQAGEDVARIEEGDEEGVGPGAQAKEGKPWAEAVGLEVGVETTVPISECFPCYWPWLKPFTS